MSSDEGKLEKASGEGSAGFLYRLAVAFPAWAGAILALYAIFLSRLGAVRIRPR